MKKLLLRFIPAALLFFITVQLSPGQVFTHATEITLTGVSNSSSAWGDYDNDGDLDILITGSNTSKIYLNDGGLFTDIAAGLSGVSYGSVAWGDYDNDGDLDILLTGSYLSIIYRNDAGAFTDIVAGLPGIYYGSAAWGDYDNDGDLDILISGVTSSSDRISRVYRNDNGIFTDMVAGLPGVYQGSAAWGDYDNDHDLDILLTGVTTAGERISRIYRNDNGCFININAGLYGTSYSSVAWGDYDSDGDLDVLISGYSYVTKLYRNDAGSFNEVITGIPGTMYSSVAWGDSDNDGDLDVLISGYSRTGYITKIYISDSGSFTDSGDDMVGISRGCALWGDYDKDGDLDILVNGMGISRIYRNNTAVANSVPAAPSGLTATSTGSGMVLSWNKSTDSQTAQAGLSYNLYIGTASGAVNRRTPMAILPGGYRKIIRQGDIQSNSWTIKRLPAGTYYWSVQSIDNNFAGSPFATQTTFTVPFSNSIAPAADQIIAVNQSAATLTVTESSTPASRQWKYSTVKGGPYNQTIVGATALTCAPSFSSSGTYYIICESVKSGIAFISNEVKIIVSDFMLQTGIGGTPAVKSGTVRWGDYDNDDDLDIFVSGNSTAMGDISMICRNDAGVFTALDYGLTGVSNSSADWGDYDNDGDLDLAVTGSYTSVIYRNDGDLFSNIGAALTGVQQGSAAWGDYDNDGDLDLLLSGITSGSYSVTILYRNNYGIFADAEANLPGASNSSVAWGDYDNDGDLDILLSGVSGTAAISRIYQNNNGLFTDIGAGLAGASGGSAAWGDYDNDGDLDILLTGAGLAYLYNNNNGNFAQLSTALPGVYYSSAIWGDYDNDGDLDILVTGNSIVGVISRIYRNENGVFNEVSSGLTAVSNGSAAWADYDNDRDLDILITGVSSAGNVSLIYKNIASSLNTAPSALSGLTALSEPNKVIFSWEKSTDSQTLQDGLTYNLYIGTLPGSMNIRSPMSALPGGYRMVAQRGIQGNSWYVEDLPAGTYYWSVQAVDNSFIGSPFAPENTFTVQYSTTVTPGDIQNLVINSSGITLIVTETTPADSRQWKYSTTAGGPYNNLITGATGTDYMPFFTDWGTYFVVCESTKDSKVYRSNEVRINVPVLTVLSTASIPGTRYGSVRWGDFDSDGDLDILKCGGGNPTAIYQNDAGIFNDTGISLPVVTYGCAQWGDYDNDGDLDVLLIGNSSRIYRNDGGLTFTNIGAPLSSMIYPSCEWGDYDNDGDLDVIVAGSTLTQIYRNDNGSFTDINAELSGVDYGSVAWGDYDSDKDLDILLTGYGTTEMITRIYRNDKGSFTGINTNIPGIYYGSAVWGDYDNDGDLDILMSGYTENGENITRIYRNDNGIFPDIGAGFPGLRNASVSWHDYDNDGDLDVFISGINAATATNVSEIYRDDNGTFTSINAKLNGIAYGSSSWGDFDNDGDVDLIISGQSSGSGLITTIYRNNITTANTSPSVPSNLQAVVSSNKVDLSWSKSTDSRTPQNGISYNIYIGSGPGMFDKKSPMATLPDGYRKIPAKGNQVNSWTIRNLTAGTYNWSVQAIDNTFAGSAFAVEGSFTVVFSNSVAPAGEQVLDLNQDGAVLTVTESAVPASRQWKYSTVSGGPYNQVIAGATGTTYTPNFSSLGTYFVVCESVYNLNTYTTNEVKIRVPVFSDKIGLEPVYWGSAEWGDYDNDGDPDIIVTGYGEAIIYRNDAGTFVNINAGLPGVQESTSRWGDYDNDGDLDLFLAGYTSLSGTISRIYRNNAGTFTDIKAGFPGIEAGSAAWGDYDNDGDLDILINGSGLSALYRNDDGIFNDVEALLPGADECTVAWGDYDKDGDLDILITGSTGTSGISKVFRNDNGEFSDINAGLTDVSRSSAAWGDYDNDGDLDILLAGKSGLEPVTMVYRNNGGTFTDISAGLQGVYYSSTLWGDYDNDGDLDILIAGNTGAGEICRIYRNDGGLFTDIKDGIKGVQQSSIAWGDYDKDGDLDILLTGADVYGVVSIIYKNNVPAANALPAAPSNLQSVPGANSISLSWDKSTDSTTPQNGLTYNIYIGSLSGNTDISTPQSSVPGGYRRVVRAENHSNTRIIKNLPAGSYFWSVQALDNSFAGSAFAAEAGFTINYSNSISPSANQSLSINEDGTTLTVNESSPADTRQWKYSLVRGGPYDQIIPGATGITYTPRFPAWGIYYVVCESTKDAIVYTSNEVKINLPVFLEQTGISLIGLRFGSAKWGDYDNDGDLDILLVGGNNEVNVSKIYRNDNGIFTDINAALTGIYQATAAWGDYDNDGDLDLFLAGYISSLNYCAKIYRNDSGVFSDIAAGLTGLNIAAGAWADYDNDGDLDLVLGGMSASGGLYVTTLYKNVNGVFTDINAGLPGIYQGSMVWGDYDNDGDQDILISGRLYNGQFLSSIYRNNNGTFIDISAGLTGLVASSAAWGDYDNDGDLDLFMSGGSDGSGTRLSVIYRNDNGIFTNIDTGLPGVASGSSVWGDYDNDGDIDLLISGGGASGNITRVYNNNGGVFTDINADLPDILHSSVAWGDYNNDGSLDIIVSGWNLSEHFTLVYKNTNSVTNIAPSAPSNLAVTAVSVSEVNLVWDKASDTETPQNALTYNLRAGTSTGTGNVICSMASLTSGYRRIPAVGNAEFKNTGYTLNNLSPGTYYWSVQAIDQAYAGGSWAAESSFTLLAGPAATAATSVLQTNLNANWGSVALATGYKLDVASDALFTTFLAGYQDKDVGNALSSPVTSLNANTTYYYRIRAYQAGGTSLIYSNTITVTTPVEVPVPTANPATAITQTGFAANWTTVASAVSYSLDVSTDNTFASFVTGYNNKNVGSVITSEVTGLTANTTYYYRVRADGVVGSSVNSNTVTATTLPLPPAAPASIAAESITSTGFVLKWRTVPTATTYYLDISTDNAFASFITGYNNLNNGSDTSKTVTGLSPATIYYFRARAGNTGGTSSSSATGNAATLPEIPAAPVTSAAGNIGQLVFTANWSASSGATGYRLDVSTDASFTALVSGYDNLDAGNVTSYNVSGLTAKTGYYYRIRAYNVSGTSGNSNSVSVTTLPNPPAAPSGLTASSCNNLVTLSWTANTETDFQKYLIYGGTAANPTTRIDSTLSISTVTKTISGLTSGQTYYFRITAVIPPGVASQYSTSVSVLVKKGVIPKIKSKFSGALLVCYNIGDSIASWQWYKGTTSISGATKQYFVTGGVKDSYSVLTTDKNSCQNSSNIINLTGTKSVSLYPNPAEDNFTLKFTSEFTGRTIIALYNASGIKVSEYQTDKPDEELECIVPVSNLPDGLYTVEIVIEGEIVEYSRVMVIN
ncbi:MAG: hypothetical protein A2Y71_16695 [Bacteroidetes bacterium RBG_13_42_15]|nr:MAG: hypothetical protein A2Y71_16695 [Bacteroidetes bacterium RBG_13_42_15]